MSNQRYDLIVIGSGPAGQKGAIAAAKLGKDVAIIDREKTVGGVRLHGGTVPSKTLREAILHLRLDSASGRSTGPTTPSRIESRSRTSSAASSPSSSARWR
jgi:pyruvate/2-oxoglutarate dehydrogenase complex dihydrolipoamide dehydrogenase (E3) component